MKASKIKWTQKRPEPKNGDPLDWHLWFLENDRDMKNDKEYLASLRREYDDERAWEKLMDSPTFFVMLVANLTLIASVGFSISYAVCH